jgi:hypothetical protein
MCHCRIADALVSESNDPWSLTNLCEGSYTSCQTWRDEKQARWAVGRGVLEQMEREDSEARERHERSTALRDSIQQAEQDAQRDW